MYELILQPKADQHLDAHIRSGNKQLLKKIYMLFEELKQHPQTGTGKPEKLKYLRTGLWSRRIDDKHRMVYSIQDEIVTVFVISLLGHYDL